MGEEEKKGDGSSNEAAKIAFRDMTNDELSKIFYAGAAKKGKY